MLGFRCSLQSVIGLQGASRMAVSMSGLIVSLDPLELSETSMEVHPEMDILARNVR